MRFSLNSETSGTKKENAAILDELEMITEEKFSNCFQCAKCSAGCPASEYMDLYPHQVILMAKIGLFERIFESKSIWICTCCFACGSRCPQDIDPARIMEGFRLIALRKTESRPEVYPFKGEIPRQAYVAHYRKNFK